MCVIISIFPIVSNTLFGLLSAERSQHDLFTLHNASRRTRLRKLQLPAALPAIFTGFRIAAGLSVIGAVVGELFFRARQQGHRDPDGPVPLAQPVPTHVRRPRAVVAARHRRVHVLRLARHAIVGRWHESDPPEHAERSPHILNNHQRAPALNAA